MTIIRTDRKTIAIQIQPDGEVVVRCPKGMSQRAVQAFVSSKQAWIDKQLARQEALPQLPALTPEEVKALTQLARQSLPEQVAYYAELLNVTYGKVTIRSQRTRWGSCSSKGDLNFNCLLMLVPEEIADYVIVHELCHRKEMNHSPRFWAEVERVMPDYKQKKAWLKERGAALIQRLYRKV